MGKPTLTISFRSTFGSAGKRWIGYHQTEYIGLVKRTRGTETSQYPEEKTSTEIPVVVASEPGPGQCSCEIKTNDLERSAIVGESPVVIKQQETRVGRDT